MATTNRGKGFHYLTYGSDISQTQDWIKAADKRQSLYTIIIVYQFAEKTSDS